jgi:AraC-like DNA-binding protein
MKSNRFTSDPGLPWIEIRRTQESTQSYKDHFHPELFIAAVTSGETEFTTPHGSAVADRGSLVVLAPETVHRCTPIEGARSYTAAFIDPAWCLELQHELFGDASALFLPQQPLLKDPVLFQCFIELTDLLEQPLFLLKKKEALSRFVSSLLCLKTPAELVEPQMTPRVIGRMKKWLAADPAAHLRLQQLALELGYSQHYLLRCFKKGVGLTPHEYRLNLRIENAKELLRSGMPPAEVAAATGFFDQSHLHRTFKQFISATPRQFQLRKN